MVRNNRQLTRLFFVLVIVMGLFGAQFAMRNWQPNLAEFDAANTVEGADWIDLIAGLGEEAIQLFLGLTSGN
jgi:hypothetical protein